MIIHSKNRRGFMGYDNSKAANKPVTQFTSENKCTKIAIWRDRRNTDDFTASINLRYYDKEKGEFVDKKSLFPKEWEDLALTMLAAIKWRCDYLGMELPPKILDFMKYGFSVVADADSSPESTIAKKMNQNIDRANQAPKPATIMVDTDDDDIPF